MTTKQENKFTMYITLRDYLAPQSALTNPIPGFSPLFAQFQANITQIQNYRDVQEGDKTGVTVNKKQQKETLILLSVDTSRKLVAYATLTNNAALEREVDFPKSTLRKAADTILKDRAQLLYNRAQTNLASLATYGITAPTQATFLAAINAYQSAIPKPKLSLNDRRMATENIESTFAQNDIIIEKIDKVVEIIRINNPAFYTGYKKGRVVPQLGGGSLALRGRVTDASGNPIGRVKVEITHTQANSIAKTAGNSKHSTIKKTTDKGNFQEKNLADGTYTAIVSKLGYKTSSYNFTVTGGEMTKVDLMLEKE